MFCQDRTRPDPRPVRRARLHTQNFRRALDKTGLVKGTGAMETGTGGRPAELYRFCREQAISTGAPGLSTPRRSAD